MENTLKLRLDKAEIIKATKNIIDSVNTNKIDLENILNCIDLTSLNAWDNNISIKNMVEKVNDFNKKYKYKNVAAICIFPNFAEIVKTNLKSKDINIAVVAGGFPASQTFLSIKLAECDLAVSKGASEVDIVLPVGKFKTGEYQEVFNEIFLIKQTIGKAHLKVILETGIHDSFDDIYHASYISMEAGADFIKTSTGKLQPAATPEASYVMVKAIKDYFEKTGKKVGFKPAGGISKGEDALIYYNIVKYILGEEWLNNKLFRIGASSLANNILSELENKEIKYF
jgi:deoxyribose-phosphate aldolase